MCIRDRNNTLTPTADDVGSPWAIGATEGGHKDILPALGTLEDFRQLVQKAKEHGIEIALDIALQCAPAVSYTHLDVYKRQTVAQVSTIVPQSTYAPMLTKEGISTTPGAM